MELYLAPLQGLTDWIFRESFYEYIDKFDKCFSPFVRIQNGEFIRPSQCKDILPGHNTFQKPIPQFLGNDLLSFRRFEELCHEHNYSEVNINMGCPFVKVANKGLGAGMLSQPDEVAQLLENIFAETKLNISLKCRLGSEDVAEFESLVPIFNNFPITEMIIHARTRSQLYKGEVHHEAFARYAALLKHPVCYNGDILSVDDVERIQQVAPNVSRLMIGRGILQNPFLLSEIRKEAITQHEKRDRLRAFHLSLIERCQQKYSGDFSLLKRFVEFWAFHYEGFEDGRKVFKQVKKCSTLAKYEGVIFKAINDM